MKHFLLYLLVMGACAHPTSFTEEEQEMLEDLRKAGLLYLNLESLLGNENEGIDDLMYGEDEDKEEDMEYLQYEEGEDMQYMQYEEAVDRGGPHRRRGPGRRRESQPRRTLLQVVTDLLGQINSTPKPSYTTTKPTNTPRKSFYRLPVATYGDYYKPVFIPFRKKKKKYIPSFINPEIMNKLKLLYEEKRSSASKKTTSEKPEEYSITETPPADRYSENVDDEDGYGSPQSPLLSHDEKKLIGPQNIPVTTQKLKPAYNSVYKLKPNQRPVSKLSHLNKPKLNKPRLQNKRKKKPSNHIQASTFHSASTAYTTKPLHILNAVYKSQSTYGKAQKASQAVSANERVHVKPSLSTHKYLTHKEVAENVSSEAETNEELEESESLEAQKYEKVSNLVHGNRTINTGHPSAILRKPGNQHKNNKQWIRLRPGSVGPRQYNKQDLYKSTFFTNLLEKDPNTHHYPVSNPYNNPPLPTASHTQSSQSAKPPNKPESVSLQSNTTPVSTKSQRTPASKQFHGTPASRQKHSTFTPKQSHSTTASPQSQSTTFSPQSHSTTASPQSQSTTFSPQSHSTTASPQSQSTTFPSQSHSTTAYKQYPSTQAPRKFHRTLATPQSFSTHPSHNYNSIPHSSASSPPSHSTSSPQQSNSIVLSKPPPSTAASPPSPSSPAIPPPHIPPSLHSQPTTPSPQPPFDPSVTEATNKIPLHNKPRKRMTNSNTRDRPAFLPTVSRLWEDFLVLEEKRRKAESEQA